MKTPKLNPFQEGENKGRKLFQEVVNQSKNTTDLTFDSDEYSTTDCRFKINDIPFVGEIKVRDAYCNNYSDLILEKKKYDALKAKAKEINGYATYINFIGEDKLYMFDLRKLNNQNCKVEMKRCRQTTAVYGGYVDKAVIMSPKELGKIYNRDDDGRWVY